MISYRDLKEILQTTVRWERQLKDLYDVAEFGVKDQAARKIILELRENHLNRLEILENVNVEDFGKVEWIKYAVGYRDEEIVPKKRITRHSSPPEIAKQILEYEEKLMSFYRSIHDSLKTETQKELFASLVKFKEIQISNIRGIVADYS
jgi:rubrerythrin